MRRPQVFDMKRPLVLPLHNYARAKEVLAGEAALELDRNDWRQREWSPSELYGYARLSQAAEAYYRCSAPCCR